jgi:ABC-type multidrug transport system ATPase subunit
MPAIQLDTVTVRFSNKTVFERFSMTVEPGEKVTLTGRSGAGKSTVLRCILGFVVPDEGVITITGERLTGATVWKLRRQLAYVAQEPLLGSGTVNEILKRPFSYKANAHLRNNLLRIPELFYRFCLEKRLLDEDVKKLSGGEKQRVAIINALLLDRKIFLLDEMTSALDRESKRVVVDYFCSNGAYTVVAVSHEAEESPFADQIIVLDG